MEKKNPCEGFVCRCYDSCVYGYSVSQYLAAVAGLMKISRVIQDTCPFVVEVQRSLINSRCHPFLKHLPEWKLPENAFFCACRCKTQRQFSSRPNKQKDNTATTGRVCGPCLAKRLSCIEARDSKALPSGYRARSKMSDQTKAGGKEKMKRSEEESIKIIWCLM